MATNWKAYPDTSTALTPENLIADQVAVGATQPTGGQDLWIDTANNKVKYKSGSSYTELSLGGVTSYSPLTDKPQINSVELSGNKTLDNIGVPPKSHASSETTYGVGTTSNYGHCKIVNALTKTAYADGEVLGAYQGKVLNDAIGEKAPTNHASSATTYGIGTTSNYGHCKLANNLTTSSYADGVALSANQGKALNDKITNLTAVSLYDNSTGTSGTVTLSQTAANFSYLEIFFKETQRSSAYGSVKVFSPNGKTVNLTSTFYSGDQYGIYVTSKDVSISGTSITNVRYGWQYVGSDRYATNGNLINIVKVVGYK